MEKMTNLGKRSIDLGAIPGPLWLFGAYAACRLGSWLMTQLTALLSSGVTSYATWEAAAVQLGGWLAALLPAALTYLLLRRSPRAVSLVSWYAGLMSLCCFAALFAPLVGDTPSVAADLVRRELVLLTHGVLWFGLLRYLERSRAVEKLFPPDTRRSGAWAAVPMLALLAIYM